MSFEMLLEAEHIKLLEKSNKMTSTQRQKVSAMGKLGWSILKKVDNKVIMHKNDKEVFVYDTGKTFFITTSGKEVEISDVVDVVDKE